MSGYGVFIGRCQPFHLGHATAVHDIICDGREPIFMLGSCNVLDERNPFTPNQRRQMIHAVFPSIMVIYTMDFPGDDDTWWHQITSLLGKKERMPETVFYTHRKDGDFDLGAMIESRGGKVKRYEPLVEIHATNIRRDLHGNRRFLDGRVYQYLCQLEKETGNVG